LGAGRLGHWVIAPGDRFMIPRGGRGIQREAGMTDEYLGVLIADARRCRDTPGRVPTRADVVMLANAITDLVPELRRLRAVATELADRLDGAERTAIACRGDESDIPEHEREMAQFRRRIAGESS
jgi:hypothetical protein